MLRAVQRYSATFVEKAQAYLICEAWKQFQGLIYSKLFEVSRPSGRKGTQWTES